MVDIRAGRKASLWPGGGSVSESSVQDARRPKPAEEMTRRVACYSQVSLKHHYQA